MLMKTLVIEQNQNKEWKNQKKRIKKKKTIKPPDWHEIFNIFFFLLFLSDHQLFHVDAVALARRFHRPSEVTPMKIFIRIYIQRKY